MGTFHDYARMGIVRYIKTTKFMIEDRLEESLRQCATPTLIVRGERDKIVPRRWVNYLCEQMSACIVKEIAGAPHVVQFKEVKRLKRLCRSFINK